MHIGKTTYLCNFKYTNRKINTQMTRKHGFNLFFSKINSMCAYRH